MSVLFGPNGAGKSNFLDALQLLSKIAASRTLKDAFEPPYRGKPLESFAFGPKGMRGLLEKALRTILPNVEKIDVGVNDLGEVELKLVENGISMPARILSEGTLRILGLLAIAGAKEQPSLIGFEEPENGIHPRRIQLVAELLKTRALLGETQYVVTTHSPLLPDLISDEYLFVCKKIKGETRIEPFTPWGELAKKSMIDKSLMEEEDLAVSERMLRGDCDA